MKFISASIVLLAVAAQQALSMATPANALVEKRCEANGATCKAPEDCCSNKCAFRGNGGTGTSIYLCA